MIYNEGKVGKARKGRKKKKRAENENKPLARRESNPRLRYHEAIALLLRYNRGPLQQDNNLYNRNELSHSWLSAKF